MCVCVCMSERGQSMYGSSTSPPHINILTCSLHSINRGETGRIKKQHFQPEQHMVYYYKMHDQAWMRRHHKMNGNAAECIWNTPQDELKGEATAYWESRGRLTTKPLTSQKLFGNHVLCSFWKSYGETQWIIKVSKSIVRLNRKVFSLWLVAMDTLHTPYISTISDYGGSGVIITTLYTDST